MQVPATNNSAIENGFEVKKGRGTCELTMNSSAPSSREFNPEHPQVQIISVCEEGDCEEVRHSTANHFRP